MKLIHSCAPLVRFRPFESPNERPTLCMRRFECAEVLCVLRPSLCVPSQYFPTMNYLLLRWRDLGPSACWLRLTAHHQKTWRP